MTKKLIVTFLFINFLFLFAPNVLADCNPAYCDGTFNCDIQVGNFANIENLNLCSSLPGCTSNTCCAVYIESAMETVCYPKKGVTPAPQGQPGTLGGTCLPQPSLPCDSTSTPVQTGGVCQCLKSNLLDLPIPAPDVIDGKLIGTALGDIPILTATDFTAWLLSATFLIAGGITFLLMLFGSLNILLSSGDEKKVLLGYEIISSAVEGLIFITLSLFILRLIGIQLLGIPGIS
jgi:hypothetical protein